MPNFPLPDDRHAVPGSDHAGHRFLPAYRTTFMSRLGRRLDLWCSLGLWHGLRLELRVRVGYDRFENGLRFRLGWNRSGDR
jgi:hypothetical protein